MARILIVDDEANIRMMIGLALKFTGHEPTEAADGEQALRLFGDGQGWDLVLLDHRMPGQDGLSVLRTMRSIRTDVRVILITAFGTIDLAYQAIRQGAIDFLRKPFTSEMLRGAVGEALAAPAGRVEATTTGTEFGMTTINGYRVEPVCLEPRLAGGDVSCQFSVRAPGGGSRTCQVVLSHELVTLVNDYTGGQMERQNAAVWGMLCEEVVANYVWQNSDFPEGDRLCVDELTSGLRRFIDAVLEGRPGPGGAA